MSFSVLNRNKLVNLNRTHSIDITGSLFFLKNNKVTFTVTLDRQFYRGTWLLSVAETQNYTHKDVDLGEKLIFKK